jgi:hypothetical protein
MRETRCTIFVQKTSSEDSNLETQKQMDLREIVYGVYWFMIKWGASVKTMDLLKNGYTKEIAFLFSLVFPAFN